MQKQDLSIIPTIDNKPTIDCLRPQLVYLLGSYDLVMGLSFSRTKLSKSLNDTRKRERDASKAFSVISWLLGSKITEAEVFSQILGIDNR